MMALVLNPGKSTKKQIEEAEPIIRAIEQYERKIQAEHVCKNIEDITNGSFEQAKMRKDRIASMETRKRALCEDLENILNARNIFDEKRKEAEAMVQELEAMKERWGF